jgi:hypothetical protein
LFVRWLSSLLTLLLILGGDPLGILTVPASSATAPAEDDDNIETVKLVVQAGQVHAHRPRFVRHSASIRFAHQPRQLIPDARPILSASTAFLATVNSPLTC